MEEKDLFFDW